MSTADQLQTIKALFSDTFCLTVFHSTDIYETHPLTKYHTFRTLDSMIVCNIVEMLLSCKTQLYLKVFPNYWNFIFWPNKISSHKGNKMVQFTVNPQKTEKDVNFNKSTMQHVILLIYRTSGCLLMMIPVIAGQDTSSRSGNNNSDFTLRDTDSKASKHYQYHRTRTLQLPVHNMINF